MGTSKGLHYTASGARDLGGGDFRRCLGRQSEVESLEQQLQFGLGLGVAREDQLAPIGGGHVYIDHLDGGELLEHAARGEAWGERFELLAERDVQAVGEERDEDVRFDAPLLLVEDRAGSPDRL